MKKTQLKRKAIRKISDKRAIWGISSGEIKDILLWVEAFCSCAIEGNKLGQYMCKLWNANPEKFLIELEKLLKDEEKKNKENKPKEGNRD